MTSKKRSSRSSSKTEEESEIKLETLQKSNLPPQKILFVNDEIRGSSEIECIHMRHPRTDCEALFMLGLEDGKIIQLAELTTFDEGHRSWFIGETVMSDGKLYIATPFNPTYLVLPYLINSERLVPLDQLLDDEQFPSMVRLTSLAAPRLSKVADAKGSADLNVWKYNSDKTLSWLEARCRRLATTLMEKKVPTTTAQALTFVRTMDQQQTKDAYLALSHGIVSEYLPCSVSQSLRERLNLPSAPIKPTKSTESFQQPPIKKQKTEGPVDDYSQSSPVVKKDTPAPTAKSKALAKSAVGNKSIMSFFAKK